LLGTFGSGLPWRNCPAAAWTRPRWPGFGCAVQRCIEPDTILLPLSPQRPTPSTGQVSGWEWRRGAGSRRDNEWCAPSRLRRVDPAIRTKRSLSPLFHCFLVDVFFRALASKPVRGARRHQKSARKASPVLDVKFHDGVCAMPGWAKCKAGCKGSSTQGTQLAMLVRDLALLGPDEKPNHTLPGRGPASTGSPSVLLIRARPASRDVLKEGGNFSSQAPSLVSYSRHGRHLSLVNN